MPNHDAIVIRTGQSGPALARRLVAAGQKVAVIERKSFGGTRVNTGCTPTKALVASAYAAYLARRASDYGLTIGGPKLRTNVPAIWAMGDCNGRGAFTLRLHPLAVRVMDWINAGAAMIMMIMSGWKIYNDYIIFSWLPFPDATTLGTWAQHWHLFGTCLAYLIYGIVPARQTQALSRFVAQPHCDRARCHDPGLKHDDLTVPVGNSRAACATYGGSKDLMIRKFAYGHAAPQAAQALEPTGPTRVHEAVSGRPHAAPRLH
jgi:hypothetical protein